MFERLLRGVWRQRAAPDWAALVAPDGDAVMTAVVRDRFHAKQGRSIARWTLTADRRLVVYIKRYFRAPWLTRLAASLCPWRRWSAASQEANNLDWAVKNGFRVPRVVALGEKVGPWFQLRSYLALEELTGMLALHEAIPAAARTLAPAAFAAWKRGLTRALARVVSRLHGMNRFHKDLYLCHFFIPEQDTRSVPADWDLAVIDLHRLDRHRWITAWWRLKDLAQLLYSSDVLGVTARDRLRFARLYAPENRRSLSWRFTRWAVGVRWKNYERHNQSRKLSRAA